MDIQSAFLSTADLTQVSNCLKEYLKSSIYLSTIPFPFFILITMLIQATQAGRWLIFCQPVVLSGWLVMGTKMSIEMKSKTDLTFH